MPKRGTVRHGFAAATSRGAASKAKAKSQPETSSWRPESPSWRTMVAFEILKNSLDEHEDAVDKVLCLAFWVTTAITNMEEAMAAGITSALRTHLRSRVEACGQKPTLAAIMTSGAMLDTAFSTTDGSSETQNCYFLCHAGLALWEFLEMPAPADEQLLEEYIGAHRRTLRQRLMDEMDITIGENDVVQFVHSERTSALRIERHQPDAEATTDAPSAPPASQVFRGTCHKLSDDVEDAPSSSKEADVVVSFPAEQVKSLLAEVAELLKQYDENQVQLACAMQRHDALLQEGESAVQEMKRVTARNQEESEDDDAGTSSQDGGAVDDTEEVAALKLQLEIKERDWEIHFFLIKKLEAENAELKEQNESLCKSVAELAQVKREKQMWYEQVEKLEVELAKLREENERLKARQGFLERITMPP